MTDHMTFGSGRYSDVVLKAVDVEDVPVTGISGSRRVLLPAGVLSSNPYYADDVVHVKFSETGYYNEHAVEAWAKALGWDDAVPETVSNDLVFSDPGAINEAAVCTRWLRDVTTLHVHVNPFRDTSTPGLGESPVYHRNRIFELLISKSDAHGANTLVQEDGERVWSIDHDMIELAFTPTDDWGRLRGKGTTDALKSMHIKQDLMRALTRPLPNILGQRVRYLLAHNFALT